jgi:FlaA1/EpsC-like NDP-sugar epimerase
MDRLGMHLSGRFRSHVAMILLVMADILALLGALALSLMLRFDGLPLAVIYANYVSPHLLSLPVIVAIYVSLFVLFRLYRYAWRFASLESARGIVVASTMGLICSIAAQWLVDRSLFPRSVFVIFWMMGILLVGSTRILLRLASLSRSYGGSAVRLIQRDFKPRRVVILGGGFAGAQVVNALREQKGINYEIIGFLDDNPEKQGIYIRNVRVIGPLKHLETLLTRRAVDEVLIALPEASGSVIRECVMACRKHKVPVKIIPALRDVLNGKSAPHIENISVEDLLRRPPVCVDDQSVGNFVRQKRVLVTGAGGSIGSELCRQILRFEPTSLILLGHGENSINLIHQELRIKYPELADRLKVVIASVADEARINQVLHQHRPHIVFHTAAHKHVPIMEVNAVEAMQNNVLGTYYVLEAAGRYGAEHVLLISSDKAVRPSNVMGATKWLCEKIAQSMVDVYRHTTYITVRFGNVLGSRGSVVPLFHEQIKRGGPVTVTHPEMTRYFMLIPEAVQLVLQASATGKSGELYLLDMGEPVKIVDLACDMIRLCGYEPNVDIPIVFTGPRPGEKLHEGLVNDDETLEPAPCSGFSIIRRSKSLTNAEVMDIIRSVQQLVNRGDSNEVYEFLGDVIPGFARRTLLGRLG